MFTDYEADIPSTKPVFPNVFTTLPPPPSQKISFISITFRGVIQSDKNILT